MSLAEFLYPVLQSIDWWQVYHRNNVQIQIGGSDQFGNIVAGVDAIKYIIKNHPDPDMRQHDDVLYDSPMGFTVPLLKASSGEKFGKTAGNAIWLDKDMTSTFDLYQVCYEKIEQLCLAQQLIVPSFSFEPQMLTLAVI